MENVDTKLITNDKKEFVSSIITNEEGNVLILKRRDDLELDPGKYDLCSGHIKEGEAPIQAMYRELKEEIGLKPEQIKLMEKLGVIETPHEKFFGTLCHMYNVSIDLSLEELNQMIHNVEKPEMVKAMYLEDIENLKRMQEETDILRLIKTKQMGIVLDVAQERVNKRINNRKENETDLCEER